MHFKTETIVGIFILAATAVFLYMSYQLGSLRFDTLQHVSYTLYCKDVAGLTQKADIKISGVKVGWVDSVDIDGDAGVKLALRVIKSYPLHENMQALIRQEGLLGAKYLELIPDNTPGALIKPGATLPFSMRQFVSIDELFYSFQKITQQIETMGASSQDIAALTKDFIKDLKKSLALVDTLLARLGHSTDSCTQSVSETAKALQEVAGTINQTLAKVQEPVAHMGDLARKLQEGQGSLGKLINDPQVYEDVKYTTQFAQRCINRVRNCALALDTHFEVLPQQCARTNVKGYFDVWLYPCSDIFCLVGPVYSHRGFAKRKQEIFHGHCKNFIEEKRDSFRLNLQVGGRLPAGLQVRAGLFQGTAGFGIDWCLPFDCVHWITTFEAFDFKGHSRFDCDDRPYLKWINRLHFSNNAYIAFGANDFISKRFKSGFIGLGATFSSCDIWPCAR